MSVPADGSVLKEVAAILRQGRFSPLSVVRAIQAALRFGFRQSRALPELRRSFWRTVAVLALGFVGVAGLLFYHVDMSAALAVLIAQAMYAAIVLPFPYAHLSLVADSEGRPYEHFGVPNALTLLRFLYLPSIVGLLVLVPSYPSLTYPTLLLYAALALSDMLDGQLARLLSHTSDFGRVYDPICDMFFNTAVALGLWAAGGIPWWLALAIAFRYVTAFVGGAIVYVFRGPYRVRPTTIGKIGALAVGGVVGLAALRLLLEPAWLPDWVMFGAFLVTAIIAVINALYLVARGIMLRIEGSYDDGIY